MDQFVNTLDAFISDYFAISIPDIHPTDVVEILIIAAVLYEVMSWIKNTRAWMLFRGILIIFALFFVASIFQMNTILWLGERVLNAGLIAIIVVFQPELRHALEQLGRREFLQRFNVLNLVRSEGAQRYSDKTVGEIVRASYELGSVKTGALIAFAFEIPLIIGNREIARASWRGRMDLVRSGEISPEFA